jgi:hypothetical protein
MSEEQVVEQEEVVDRGDELVSESPLSDAGKDVEPETEDEAPAAEADVSEEEGEETDEEREEREAAEAEEARKRNIRIPKARFDEAVSKARAREAELNRRIEELEGQLGSTTQTNEISDMKSKIEELQDKYEDLIMDGEKEAARKVRREVDAMRDELIELQTSTKSDTARKAAIDDMKYESALARIESEYPELNPDLDSFDEEKTDEVAVLVEAFMARGFNRHVSLQKSVKYVLGNPVSKDKAASEEETAVMKADRARKAREKAAEADKKQPAPINKAGVDSDKAGVAGELGIDIMKLSQSKFAKLDEETKARLRGDDV